MQRTAVLSLLLAALSASLASVTVETDAGCEICPQGFVCDSATRGQPACVLDEQSLWTLTIADGWVAETDASGEPWDSDGDPDPYVFVCNRGDVGGSTQAIQNTRSPNWNQLISANSVSVAALRAGFRIELRDDDDPNGFQTICTFAEARIDEGDLRAGNVSLSCDSGGLNITLELAGDNVSDPVATEMGPCNLP